MYCIVRVDLLRQGYASEGPSEIPVWACDEEQGRVYPLQVAQGGPTWHHFQQPRRFGSPDPKAYPHGHYYDVECCKRQEVSGRTQKSPRSFRGAQRDPLTEGETQSQRNSMQKPEIYQCPSLSVEFEHATMSETGYTYKASFAPRPSCLPYSFLLALRMLT